MSLRDLFFLAAALVASSCQVTQGPEPRKRGPLQVDAPRYRPMLVVPMPDVRAAEAKGTKLEALTARNTPIGDVLLTMFKDSDINLLVDAELQGTSTFDIKNTTVESAFEAILRSQDLAFAFDGDFLRIRRHERAWFDVDLLHSEGNAAGAAGEQASTGPSSTSIWDTLRTDLQTMVTDGERILVNASAGVVEIEAKPSVVARVREYLERTVRRSTAQVSLEARILEVRLNEEFRFGVDWALLSGLFNSDEVGRTASGGFVEQLARSGADAFSFGVLKTGDFSVFVDALESQGQVRVLSSPRISTLNNVPANIRVVDRIPVIDREVIDSQGGLRTQFDIRFVEAGVTLIVTPQVGKDGIITVSVQPSVIEQTGTITTPDGLQTEPILSTRATQTSVRVADGRAIVIGGLRSTRKSENGTGIPLLRDLPLVGPLFRSTVQVHEEVELMVLLVPRVLDDAWIAEDVRRGADRLVALRKPFTKTSIDIEAQRPEDWRGGALQGKPESRPEQGPGLRTAPETKAEASGASLTVTRRGLAGRFVARAREALARGQRRHAVEQFERALALAYSTPVAITTGILRSRIGDSAGARRHLDAVLREEPTQPFALTARGAIEMGSGRFHAALPFLEKAHEKSANELTATNLGAVLLALGRNDDAHAVLSAQVNSSIRFPELLANLAFAALELGQEPEARTHFEAALRAGADPNDPRIDALARKLGPKPAKDGASR